MKDNKSRSGSLGSSERGGGTQRRQSWAGKVVYALDRCGTDTRKPFASHASHSSLKCNRPWFTNKAIQKQLQDYAGGLPENLSHVLYGLIKSGHIERAYRPGHTRGKKNYIYRRTGKAFREKQIMGEVEKALMIKFENPKLAKWFREMMIY